MNKLSLKSWKPLVAVIAVSILGMPSPSMGAVGDLDSSFNSNAVGRVNTISVLPGGKVLIGGEISSVARLNTDGSLDEGFNPIPIDYITSTIILPDGKILLAGRFPSQYHVRRLNADGTPDAEFDIQANGPINGMVLQSDGKVVIGGEFSTVGGEARRGVARLNPDGTLDMDFVADAFYVVYSVALQQNGKILIGGQFTTVSGVTRHRIARLETDGSVDPGFVSDVGGNDFCTVRCIVEQADGKILIGGDFTTVNSVTRSKMARLNPNGSLDLDFDPNVGFFGPYGAVNSMALQADGRILVAGKFAWVGPWFRNSIARINTDGSVDSAFQTNPTGGELIVALQADGKALVGGGFTDINGINLTGIARIENDPVTQSFAMPGGTAIQWWRGGAAPEAQRVTFEYSNDGGDTWSLLGSADRVPGGWEKTGLSLPITGKIRARGYVSGGNNNGGLGLVETSFNYVTTPEIAVEQPVGNPVAVGDSREFGNVVKEVSSTQTFTVRNLGFVDLAGLTITKSGDDESLFTVTPNTLSPINGPEGSATFAVEFKPQSVGFKTATIHIASNDPDEGDFEINLSGTGVLPPPTIRGLTFDVVFQFDEINHMKGTLETTQTGTFSSKTAVEDFFNGSKFSILSMIGETEFHIWNNENAAWSLELGSFDFPGNQEVAVISSADELTIDFTTPNETSSVVLLLREGATSNFWQVSRQNNNVSDENYSILQYDFMADGQSKQLPYDSKISFQALDKPDSISGNAATIHAHVNPNGSNTTVTFIYGTTPTLVGGITTICAAQTIGSGTDYVEVHESLLNLQPDTTYYYQATAHNGGGDVPGPILSFKTTDVSPLPMIRGLTFEVALQFDDINHIKGTLETKQTGTFSSKAAVEDFFNGSKFSIQSRIGETTFHTWNNENAAWTLQFQSLDLPGNQEVAVISSTDELTIDFTTSNENSEAELRLREGATFNFWQVLRQTNNVFDQNSSILQYDSMVNNKSKQLPYDSKLSFQALGKPDGISGSAATIHAHVNPNGSNATVTFIYGTTPALVGGFSTTCAAQAIGSGMDYVEVHESLINLQPDTVYYYQATAHNGFGDVAGPIRSFTTQAYSPAETWRLNYFGSPGNSGNASDNATPKQDGIPNIIKFATGMDPTKPGTMPGTATRGTDVDTFTFTYHRSKAAVAAGISFVVEWSETLLPGSWSNSGVSETFVDQGAKDLVTATIPAGSAGHRFVRLRVVGS